MAKKAFADILAPKVYKNIIKKYKKTRGFSISPFKLLIKKKV
jgi:hypothetical protein